MEHPKSRKLKDFFKDKAPAAKRFKSLTSYIDSKARDEILHFFSDHAELIFTVFFDRFVECETSVKKGKHHTNDLLALLAVLKKILTYLDDLVAKRWKFQMIARIIEKCMTKENKHEIRMAGFELLLILIEIFGSDADENVQNFLLPAFAQSLTLDPFLTDDQKAQLDTRDSLVLCPSNKVPSAEESVEMWDFLLGWISEREETFAFWYDLLQRQYFSMFYPQEIADMGIEEEVDIVFDFCPHELQRVLVDRLNHWTDNDVIKTVVWSEANAMLMMGFGKHACQLPISYHETITTALQFFRRVLMANKKNSFGSLLKTYWINFIHNVPEVLFIKSCSDDMVNHESLCKEVLSIYTYFSFELSDTVDEEVWDVLQTTLLETTHTLLTTYSSSDPETIAFIIADPMFQTLFLIWLRSPITTEAMWATFSAKVCDLLDWKATITQWKEKVLQLTLVLDQMLYRPQDEDGAARQAPAGYVRDPRINAMKWDADSITKAWFTLLRILGNPNAIQQGENFALALSCVQDVLDVLMGAEDRYFTIHDDRPLDLYEVFTPWLFEACTADKKRNRGCLIAYTLLCRFFIRQHPSLIDVRFLAAFYRVIRYGLGQAHSSIVWVIVRNSADIFNVNLPGAAVLIPDFLREIENLFRPENKTPPPEPVQTKAIMILNSIICYPSHFKDLDLQAMTMEEVGSQVISLLLQADKYKKIAVPKSKAYTIAGISVFLYEEVWSRRRKDVLAKGLHSLIQSCTHPDISIANLALQVLGSLAVVNCELEEIDLGLANSIIVSLCENIVQMAEDVTFPNRSEVCANHFYTLLEFLMHAPTSLSKKHLVQQVFGAVEAVLTATGSRSASSSPSAHSGPTDATPSSPATQSKKAKKADKDKRDSILRRGTRKGGPQTQAESLLETALATKPKEDDTSMVEAAETLLVLVLSQYNNFPSPAGPEQMACVEYQPGKRGDEEVNPDTVHFLYRGTSIISFRQLREGEGEAGTKVRVTVRDCTGRYVWDCRHEFEPLAAPNSEAKIVPTRSTVSMQDFLNAKHKPDPEQERRGEGEIPLYPKQFRKDRLLEVMHYLSEAHPETLPSSNVRFTEPYTSTKVPASDVTRFETNLDFQQKDEDQFLSQAHAEQPALPLLPAPAEPASVFHQCRLLLAHWGLTAPPYQAKLKYVSNNSRFRRSLQELDKRNSRELVKVAVIFVRENQEDQKDILANNTRSRLYDEFVRGMGWCVDLNTHQGFSGGLPPSAGPSSPYWSSPTTELMFHDITRMPTDPSDPQVIVKKRHVGNDIVTVVWSEHKRDYDPSTITTHFNFVHLVIYPLYNGLFRIRVHQKAKVPMFGPLSDGMVVNKSLLSPLVRATVINANRVVRTASKKYRRPLQTRLNLIKEVSERYKCARTFGQYMAHTMPISIESIGEDETPESPNGGGGRSPASPRLFGQDDDGSKGSAGTSKGSVSSADGTAGADSPPGPSTPDSPSTSAKKRKKRGVATLRGRKKAGSGKEGKGGKEGKASKAGKEGKASSTKEDGGASPQQMDSPKTKASPKKHVAPKPSKEAAPKVTAPPRPSKEAAPKKLSGSPPAASAPKVAQRPAPPPHKSPVKGSGSRSPDKAARPPLRSPAKKGVNRPVKVVGPAKGVIPSGRESPVKTGGRGRGIRKA